jgi:N-acetylneuraminic acid mutarotase
VIDMVRLREVGAWASAAALALFLGACGGGGGGGSDSSSSPPSQSVSPQVSSYAVGGTVTGLNTGGSLVLLNNHGDALTDYADGQFAFSTRLDAGAAYSVTVGTQPTGQVCTVTSGSGTMGHAAVANIAVSCGLINNWTWAAGAKLANASAVYGTQGTGAPANAPGGRQAPTSFKDAAGNLWLFGGVYYDSNGHEQFENDLWEFSVSTGVWTWKSGSSTTNESGLYGAKGTPGVANNPGARYAALGWVDQSGNFWVFGGEGYDAGGNVGPLNDLWMYSPQSGEWTWVSGTNTVGASGLYGTKGVAGPNNVPGARSVAVAATDSSGNLWLFGGLGMDSLGNQGYLNDLWKFSPASNEWTWMSGANAAGAAGVYGSRAIAALNTVPNALAEAAAWGDASGNLWIFGGFGTDSVGNQGFLNDLWKFSPTTGEWAWMSGTQRANSSASFGTQGTASSMTNPGGDSSAATWTDPSGNLWLYGGFGTDASGNVGLLGDLWNYSPSSGEWTWMKGAGVRNAAGVYGNLGQAAAGNLPGARSFQAAWPDGAGAIWTFGGLGIDSMGVEGYLDDLWLYTP